MPGISFSGISSGIDGDSIIKAMVDARRLSSISLENKVSFNKKENKALDEFKSKLIGVSDSLKKFMTAYGGAIKKSASSSNSEVLDVKAGSDAVLTERTITVKKIARGAKFSFNDRFSSSKEKLFKDLKGSQTLKIEVGEGESKKSLEIELNSLTTLESLSNEILEKGDGFLSSSIINTSTSSNPSYILSINSLKSGKKEGSLNVTVPESIKSLGVFNSSILENAQNAVIDISGVGKIERESNIISDVISGLTLEVKKESKIPISINVNNDYKKTKEQLKGFVESFNELISYSSENNKVSRLEEGNRVKNVYGSLARTGVDNRAIDEIKRVISNTKTDIDSDTVNILADLGVNITKEGTYIFKEEVFLKNIKKDPIATQKLLNAIGDKISSTKGIISKYTSYEGSISLALESNEKENTRYHKKLKALQRSIDAETQMLKKVFTNLETKIGELNAAGSALSSLFPVSFS